MADRWRVETAAGSAVDLHAWAPPDEPVRTLRFLRVDEPTIVLGSSQPETDLDPEALARARVTAARRRSGGGAVLLVPDQHVWADAWVPAGDPLWDDDVVRAPEWLGRAWAAVGDELGAGAVRVHVGPVVHTSWSDRVCFAGRGPGEVLVGERKLVGVSQRRTRAWTRIQTMVHRRWDADATFALLAGDAETRRRAEAHASAVGEVGEADVATRLVAHLPA